MKVCTLGLWHLGTVVSSCLARLGHTVTGYDEDPAAVARLSDGVPPLMEPGLPELVAEQLAEGRLSFTSDLVQAVAGADYLLLTYDTPVDADDAVDTSRPLKVAEAAGRLMDPVATFVVMSQVPVGTCDGLLARLKAARPGLALGLACSPENLQLGRAIERFMTPGFIVIGADDDAVARRVEALFGPIGASLVRLDLRTAEMFKHAVNAFTATAISFANEIGNLSEAVGVDAVALAAALRHDPRFGPQTPLVPGMGFAGGTLARDLQVLRSVGDRHGYDTMLLDAVAEVNRRQNGRVLRRLQQVYPSLQGVRVGVLGLTYKAGTSTLRRSASVEIAAALCREGVAVAAFDPHADLGELPEPVGEGIAIADDPYKAARGADALLLLTDWPEFRDLDYARMALEMRRPVIIDARNMLDPRAVRECGFRYYGLGRAG